jgi:hypothetical protein
MKGFWNGLDKETPGQAVVQIREDDDVDGGIHEGIQPEGAAALDGFPPAEETVERRAGQREQQQGHGSATGALLHGLDGIGGQVVGQEVNHEARKGEPCAEVHDDLKRGVALQEVFHAIQSSLVKM